MPFSRQVLSGKPRLGAGNRDKFVTIQQAPTTQATGSSGFPIEAWTTLRRVWMSRADTQANERFSANQPTAASEASWHMPYTADMDPEVVDVPKLRRLLYRGRTYEIISGTLIGREEGIELLTMASSKVA